MSLAYLIKGRTRDLDALSVNRQAFLRDTSL
jgi:hypothetical protein